MDKKNLVSREDDLGTHFLRRLCATHDTTFQQILVPAHKPVTAGSAVHESMGHIWNVQVYSGFSGGTIRQYMTLVPQIWEDSDILPHLRMPRR